MGGAWTAGHSEENGWRLCGGNPTVLRQTWPPLLLLLAQTIDDCSTLFCFGFFFAVRKF